MMEIGKRLKELRRATGLTQRDLAEKIGYSRVFIARVEGGAQTSVNFLEGAAEALGVTVPDLFADSAGTDLLIDENGDVWVRAKVTGSEVVPITRSFRVDPVLAKALVSRR